MGRPKVAIRAKTSTATAPAIAPRRARWRNHSSDRTPPTAAPASTAGRNISPMRRGMYWGTSPIPVARPSVAAVCLVFVSDHIALPVTTRSLTIQNRGAAAASRPSRARSRRERSGARSASLAGSPRPDMLRVAAPESRPVPAQTQQPSLGPQQAGQAEQHQNRCAGQAMPGLDQRAHSTSRV